MFSSAGDYGTGVNHHVEVEAIFPRAGSGEGMGHRN